MNGPKRISDGGLNDPQAIIPKPACNRRVKPREQYEDIVDEIKEIIAKRGFISQKKLRELGCTNIKGQQTITLMRGKKKLLELVKTAKGNYKLKDWFSTPKGKKRAMNIAKIGLGILIGMAAYALIGHEINKNQQPTNPKQV